MANSPRKPGSVRKPSPAPDADDLFSAPNEPPAAAPDEWTLEDGEPSGKPESFPSGVSLPMAMPLPAPGSVRMSPIAAPEAASFESNPRPVAGALPEVVPPASPAAPRSAPAPPTPPLPDPFEIEDDLPTVAVKPVSLPVVDPFDPPSEASEETYSKPDGLEIESTPLLAIAPRPPANRAGLLAAATLLLGLLGSFFAVLYINRPEAVTSASRPEPVLPLKGQITT